MSQFGAHVTQGARVGFGAALQQCAQAGSPVPLLFAVDQNLWSDVSQLSPQTVLIFRTQVKINKEGWDNPPEMYFSNPIASANNWYVQSKPTWLLNHAHFYAPSNERNPVDDVAQDAWIDAFDLRMMQLADGDGFKLALHGDSMGTPKYEQWPNYRASLAYAAQHGHILTLHEPIEGADLAFRYRKVHTLIESFAPGLKIAISECYGDLTGDPVHYVASFAAYDAEMMKDSKYMLGFAGYQIGGDETFAAAIPQWAAYVSTHPTPAPEPEPNMSKGGLHLSANGNNIDDPSLPKEIEAMKVAKITRCKFMSNGNPEFVHVLQANGIDLAGSVCRLYAAGDNTALGDPARFYLEQRSYITEVYGHGVRMFEIHNEPNLVTEGYGRFWNSPATFASNFYGPVARLILDNFPGAQIVYPGLAPRDDWAAWKPSITSLIAQGLVQLVGVHCYWDSAINARTAEQGRTFERFADMGKPLIITEASWNKPTGTDAQKGASYAEYIASLPSYVTAVYFFVSWGPAYDGSTETWVRGSPPALTAIPAAVGAGATPPPPTQFEFDGHYTFDGVLLSKAKDYGGVLTGDVQVETRFKRIIETFTFEHRTSPPELAGRVTATPASNGEYERGTAWRIVAT